MRIGIDLDGVIAASTQPALDIMNKLSGMSVTKEELDGWLKPMEIFGILELDWLQVLDEGYKNFQDLDAEEPLIQETIDLVIGAGHRVSILTKRTRPSFPWVCMWLDHHEISYNDLVFVGGGAHKLSYPVDCLIDDSPAILAEAKVYPEKQIYFRTQPWNKNIVDLPDNVARVETLRQAVVHIIGGGIIDAGVTNGR